MRFSKIGAALIVSTLVSNISFAEENKDKNQRGSKWITGSEQLSLTGHNNHNHNNNHNGGNNHQSYAYKVSESSITSTMMS